MLNTALTFEQFKQIPEGEVFRVVTTKHHTVTSHDMELTFVCKKGFGFDDWAIYCGPSNKTYMNIAEHGDKVQSKQNILAIFPCDEETLSKYRN